MQSADSQALHPIPKGARRLSAPLVPKLRWVRCLTEPIEEIVRKLHAADFAGMKFDLANAVDRNQPRDDRHSG